MLSPFWASGDPQVRIKSPPRRSVLSKRHHNLLVRTISNVVISLPLSMMADQFLSLDRLHSHGLSILYYTSSLNIHFEFFLLHSPLSSNLSMIHISISTHKLPNFIPSSFLKSSFCLISHP